MSKVKSKINSKINEHNIFLIGIIIKGIDGVLEFFGGLILLFIKSTFLINFIQKLFAHELTQDPTDFLANLIVHSVQNLSNGVLFFAAIYLIIHGIIKILLVWALLKKKLWAYPLTGFVLVIFIIYQITALISNFSIMLVLLTIVDFVILFLLYPEYQRIKALISNGN